MKIFNTMTAKKEEFVPMDKNEVKIYACGPTVYNYIHIGNARPLCVFDVLRRYLEYRGYNVKFVQNFTDIDDKIIKRANEEGTTYDVISKKYIEEFWTDANGLNFKKATVHPKATENIDEIIKLISTLVEKGYAYQAENDVYFRTLKFKEYGKLSHQPIEDLESGARIAIGEIKEDPLDFALWKGAKPGEPYWDSPWGKGRPGWHIECSAMNRKYLGDTIDIHCGGKDLVFPHHENEIAQSECANGCTFANYWMHNGYININNQKMSKSLGNGIDPLEVIDKYGADALRFTLITGNAPGNDMRFYWERVEASRNFANKIWNASRFIMMNIEKADITGIDAAMTADVDAAMKQYGFTLADKWILSKMNDLVQEVTDNMEKFELGIAVSKLYDFLWEEFCDWYIEMVKPRLWDDADETKAAALWTLKTVLTTGLKLLHPYMPFVTEEIFCTLTDEESIMISKWPEYDEAFDFKADEAAVDKIKEAVRGIRNVRTEMNVAPSRKASVYVVSPKEDIRAIFTASKNFFAMLGYANEVHVQADKSGIADDAVSVVIHDAAIYIPFAELVDIEKEIERLTKEQTKLEAEIKRASGMLANPKFVDKAPAAKVEEERAKLQKYTETLEQVKERLANIAK